MTHIAWKPAKGTDFYTGQHSPEFPAGAAGRDRSIEPQSPCSVDHRTAKPRTGFDSERMEERNQGKKKSTGKRELADWPGSVYVCRSTAPGITCKQSCIVPTLFEE